MTKENENNLLSYFVVDVWPTSDVFRFHMSDSVWPWMPNPSSYIRVWTKWKVDIKLIKKLRGIRKLVFVLIWSSLLQLALGDPAAHKRGMTPAKNTDFSSITIMAFVLVHFLYKSPDCCFCDWWQFTCQGSVKKIIPLSNQNIRENLGNEAKLEGTNCRQ